MYNLRTTILQYPYYATINLATVTLRSSDNALLGDLIVTLHALNPFLNFNSTRNEAFVTVRHEKKLAVCPSAPRSL